MIAVQAVADIRATTFHTYSVKLRTLLSEMFKLSGSRKKYGRDEDNRKWIKWIESIRLHRIDTAKVARWRTARINGALPEKRDSARQTTNSILRAAKSLFARKIVSAIKELHVPDPPPFAQCRTFQPALTNRQELFRNPVLVQRGGDYLRMRKPGVLMG